MRVDCQSLCEEKLVTGTDNTTIIQIYVIYKEPCTDTVVFQGTSLFNQLHAIFIEEQASLIL